MLDLFIIPVFYNEALKINICYDTRIPRIPNKNTAGQQIAAASLDLSQGRGGRGVAKKKLHFTFLKLILHFSNKNHLSLPLVIVF